MGENNIGQKIKKLRTQAGFNQSIIAEYLQVDQSLISKIEKGERDASTDILKKLSELFGCETNVFFSPDSDVSCLNVAFRSNKMSSDDLQSIAVINKIALNLKNMQKLLEAEKNEGY